MLVQFCNGTNRPTSPRLRTPPTQFYRSPKTEQDAKSGRELRLLKEFFRREESRATERHLAITNSLERWGPMAYALTSLSKRSWCAPDYKASIQEPFPSVAVGGSGKN